MENQEVDVNLTSPSKGGDGESFGVISEGVQVKADMGEGPNAGGDGPRMTIGLSEKEKEELLLELSKVEEEVQTLRQVLVSREHRAAEIRQTLGLTPLSELRQHLSRGWQDVQQSTTYKKTQETLSQAGHKTSEALSTVGSVLGRHLKDMKNSPAFKSIEGKVETTVTSIKSRVSRSSSIGGSTSDERLAADFSDQPGSPLTSDPFPSPPLKQQH
uniref:tumor protein D52-like n=1 Tax=Myxine glutinosa TaxID=7769 RepID=UPI00358EAA79